MRGERKQKRADNLAGLTRHERKRDPSPRKDTSAANCLIHECVGDRKAIKPGKYLVWAREREREREREDALAGS